METKVKTKTFDAVKMMREIRDKISDETQNMTFNQLKKYVADKLKQLGGRSGQCLSGTTNKNFSRLVIS